jgi:hypothetical protein
MRINTIYKENADIFGAQAGGTYTNHHALKG